jgi:hypothetical protein
LKTWELQDRLDAFGPIWCALDPPVEWDGPRAFGEAKLPINKVTWQRVGHVTEPGRYMFRFGWLTVAPDDLAIWKQFPDASFTLVQMLAPHPTAETDTGEAPTVEMEEYHLGAFELPVSSPPSWHGPDMTDEIAPESQSSV